MNLKATFEERDTNLKAAFGEVFIVGDGNNNLQVDQEVIEDSKNAVSGSAVKKYVDDVISQIPKPDDIELDTTLSKEGAAADAVATGNALKCKTTVENYIFDIQTLKSNGVLGTSVEVPYTSTTSRQLIVSIIFAPAFFDENGVLNKIIDAPFEFAGFNGNGAVWTNKNQFKNFGVKSPVIAQQIGVEDIVWFDAIAGILKNNGFTYDSISFELRVDSNNGQVFVSVILTATTVNEGSSNIIANNAKMLWETIFATPETKLIFEYQKQENTLTYDASYLLDSPIIIENEEV